MAGDDGHAGRGGVDLVAIRAELKSWERSFRTSHGREPGKDDIKAEPEIARKYRLYSKSRLDDKDTRAATSSINKAANPPKVVPITPSKNTRSIQREFTTPSSSRNAASQGNGATGAPVEYAFAPSPSRLRALAASKSFSGSPNSRKKKPLSLLSTTSNENGHTQASLTMLKPLGDTPRTKARKWLSGEDVSPPKKATRQQQSDSIMQDYTSTVKLASSSSSSSSASAIAFGAASKRSGSTEFWQKLEEARGKDDQRVHGDGIDSLSKRTHATEPMDDDEEEEDEVIAPSPVKPPPSNGATAKGKQRSFLNLLEECTEETMAEEYERHNGAIREPESPSRQMKSRGAGIDIFRAPLSMSTSAAFRPDGDDTMSTRSSLASSTSRPASDTLNGKPKPRKRTSTAAALMPFDTLTEAEEAEDAERRKLAAERCKQEALASIIEEQNKKKGASSASKTAAAREAKKARREDDKSKKPAQKANGTSLLAEEAGAADSLDDDPETVLPWSTEPNVPINKAKQDVDEMDDYETRDLPEEYDTYRPIDEDVQESNPRSAKDDHSHPPVIVDEGFDQNLVSILSLNASPVKHRLSKLYEKRERTVQKLLREPTFVMESKKERKGLEDLDDELAQEGDLLEDRIGEERSGAMGTDNSDDDWASEPEGWKDVGDGEMDGLDW